MSYYKGSGYGGSRGGYRGGGSSGYRGGGGAGGGGSDSSWRGGRGGSSFSSSRPVGSSGGGSSRYYASSPPSSYESRSRSSYAGGTSATERYSSSRRDESYSRYPEMSSYGSRDYGRGTSPEPPRKRVRADSPSYMGPGGPPQSMAVRGAKLTEHPHDTSDEEQIYTRGNAIPLSADMDHETRRFSPNIDLKMDSSKIFSLCSTSLVTRGQNVRDDVRFFGQASSDSRDHNVLSSRINCRTVSSASESKIIKSIEQDICDTLEVDRRGRLELDRLGSNNETAENLFTRRFSRQDLNRIGFDTSRSFGVSNNTLGSNTDYYPSKPNVNTESLEKEYNKLMKEFSAIGCNPMENFPKRNDSTQFQESMVSDFNNPKSNHSEVQNIMGSRSLNERQAFNVCDNDRIEEHHENEKQAKFYDIQEESFEVDKPFKKRLSGAQRRKLKKLASLKGCAYKDLYDSLVTNCHNSGEKEWCENINREITLLKSRSNSEFELDCQSSSSSPVIDQEYDASSCPETEHIKESSESFTFDYNNQLVSDQHNEEKPCTKPDYINHPPSVTDELIREQLPDTNVFSKEESINLPSESSTVIYSNDMAGEQSKQNDRSESQNKNQLIGSSTDLLKSDMHHEIDTSSKTKDTDRPGQPDIQEALDEKNQLIAQQIKTQNINQPRQSDTDHLTSDQHREIDTSPKMKDTNKSDQSNSHEIVDDQFHDSLSKVKNELLENTEIQKSLDSSEKSISASDIDANLDGNSTLYKHFSFGEEIVLNAELEKTLFQFGKNISDATSEEKLHIDGNDLVQGTYRIKCSDQLSFNWLGAEINKLEKLWIAAGLLLTINTEPTELQTTLTIPDLNGNPIDLLLCIESIIKLTVGGFEGCQDQVNNIEKTPPSPNQRDELNYNEEKDVAKKYSESKEDELKQECLQNEGSTDPKCIDSQDKPAVSGNVTKKRLSGAQRRKLKKLARIKGVTPREVYDIIFPKSSSSEKSINESRTEDKQGSNNITENDKVERSDNIKPECEVQPSVDAPAKESGEKQKWKSSSEKRRRSSRGMSSRRRSNYSNINQLRSRNRNIPSLLDFGKFPYMNAYSAQPTSFSMYERFQNDGRNEYNFDTERIRGSTSFAESYNFGEYQRCITGNRSDINARNLMRQRSDRIFGEESSYSPVLYGSETDNVINVIIRDESQPLGRILDKNMKILENILVELLMKTLDAPDSREVAIRAVGLGKGNYKIKCFDEYSYSWLESTINSLQTLWEGANIKLVRSLEYKLWKTIVNVPDPLFSPFDIIKKLQQQNPLLKTGRWYLHHAHIRKSKHFLVLGIDQDSLDELERLDFKPYYGPNRVRFSRPRDYFNDRNESFTNWFTRAKNVVSLNA